MTTTKKTTEIVGINSCDGEAMMARFFLSLPLLPLPLQQLAIKKKTVRLVCLDSFVKGKRKRERRRRMNGAFNEKSVANHDPRRIAPFFSLKRE